MPPGYLDPERLTFLPRALRDEIARHQHEEAETGRTRHERGLPCIWLDTDTHRCTQYEHRPDRCRAFPVGGSGCAFWRDRRAPAAPRRSRHVRRRGQEKSGGRRSP